MSQPEKSAEKVAEKVAEKPAEVDAAPESHKERKLLPDRFREAWSTALQAVGSAEEEVAKALHLSGWTPEEVRKNARAFGDKLVSQRHELEKSLDAGVKKALSRVSLPRREEVDALRARAAELTKRLEALEHSRGGSR
jgi:polyhydroxyalkanoate synthesis regulator phasin